MPIDVTVTAPVTKTQEEILSPEALQFLVQLHDRFDSRRKACLQARGDLQKELDLGEKRLGFLPETASIRGGEWKVGAIPVDLQDRRVEITGPVDRKMVINALNSGAKCYMACFEDATTPAFPILLDGQVNLRDAIARKIDFTDENSGKDYRLKDDTATLLARPRGWHLPEAHIKVAGEAISGALFDFGLFFFHNAKKLIENGSGPYFYLPKIEHYLEARLWNDVFVYAQSVLGLPIGTIKATVLIETLPAAFQTEEILWELREHIVGLNCGRWDYIFSYIKRQRTDNSAVLPDRASVTMTVPFMRSYSLHVIRTCHIHGAFAMGGMSAFIPVKNNDEQNEAAFEAVRRDKEREAKDGHDGTWVAHPGLVEVAMQAFDSVMKQPNQLDKIPEGEPVSDAELLAPPSGVITRAGLDMNVNVGIGYIASWLRGQGAAPLHNMMEDAATAEISRTQLWQWLHTGQKLDSGEMVDEKLIKAAINEQLGIWKQDVGDNFFETGKYTEGAEILSDLIFSDKLEEFLTIPAYEKYLAA